MPLERRKTLAASISTYGKYCKKPNLEVQVLLCLLTVPCCVFNNDAPIFRSSKFMDEANTG